MYILILFMVLLVLGALSQCVLYIFYGNLAQEAQNMYKTNHKLLKQIKLKYENYYSLGMKVANMEAFLGKMLCKYRIGGISIHGWRQCNKWCAFLSLIAGWTSGHALEGLSLAALFILFEQIMGLDVKEKLLYWNMEDFLENLLQYRLASMEEQEESKENVQETPQAIPQAMAAAADERTQPQNTFSSVDEKIINEILAEFLG